MQLSITPILPSRPTERRWVRIALHDLHSGPEKPDSRSRPAPDHPDRGQEMRSLLEKTVVRSPITGVVLRKHRTAGEIVSDAFDTPIVTVGDVTTLTVRADVDEKDIARLRVGQRAFVVAEAYRSKRHWGTVTRIGRMLGRKNVYTDSPTERVDRKILETIITLDSPEDPVCGLRVDAFILVEEEKERARGDLLDSETKQAVLGKR